MCKKTYEENEVAVSVYAEEWEMLMAKKKKFDCYYNTNNPENLIQLKKHDKTAVIHSMLWPSLIIIVCGIIFLKLETKRRGISFCGTAEFEKAKTERMAESVPLKNKSAKNSGIDVELKNCTTVNSQRKCNVKCKITRPSGQESSYISSSMSSIDRLTGVDMVTILTTTNTTRPEQRNCRIGVSVSADTISPSHIDSKDKVADNVSLTSITEYQPNRQLIASGSANSDRKQLFPTYPITDTEMKPSGNGYSRSSINSEHGIRHNGAETPV